MNKLLAILLILAILSPAALAVKPNVPSSVTAGTADTLGKEASTVMSLGDFCFSISPQWELVSSESNDSINAYYFHNTLSDHDNALAAMVTKAANTYTDSESLELFYKSVINGMDILGARGFVHTINGETGYIWSDDFLDEDKTIQHDAGALYCYDSNLLVLSYYEKDANMIDQIKLVQQIADTISINDGDLPNDLTPAIYQTDDIQFSISGTYLHHGDDGNYAVIGFDWTNISDEPIMFVTKLSIEAYQNGIEIDSHAPYDFDKNDWTKVLPGFGTTSYACFPISGSGDVVFVIDKYIDLSKHFEDIYITVNPDELPEI